MATYSSPHKIPSRQATEDLPSSLARTVGRLWREVMRILLVWARRMLLGYAALFVAALVGAVAFHGYAARDHGSFERAIQWSTRYILVPGTLVQDRGMSASAVFPLVRVIDTMFIATASVGPESDAHRYWQGRLLLPLAATYGRLGDRQRQLSRGQRAVQIFADLAHRHPSAIDYRRRLARAHDLLADDLASLGRIEGAVSSYRSALLISEGLQRDEPDVGRWRRYRIKALAGIAAGMQSLGRYQDAADFYAQARAEVVGVPAEVTGDTEWRRILGAIEAGPSNGQTVEPARGSHGETTPHADTSMRP